MSGHLPVMLAEVLEGLNVQQGGVYIDGTFGAGGYTKAILSAGAANVLAFDRDLDAITRAQPLVAEAGGRLAVQHDVFSNMASYAAVESVDGIVLDIGVSSFHLDEEERGFSYHTEGPLDMRMGQQGITAADILNSRSEEELADIFYHYGEVRKSRPLAAAVVRTRREEKFVTTQQLRALCEKVLGRGGYQARRHPAAQVFQALRIAVNDELGELERTLHNGLPLLKNAGRFVVVTFHSLEDRIVKNAFREAAAAGGFKVLTKKPVEPTQEEVSQNRRARSAKLRVLQKVSMQEVQT